MFEQDEVVAIQEELNAQASVGYQRKRQWITTLLQEDGERLMLGQIKDPVERSQAEGRCQAYKRILDRDQEIQQAWREYQLEEEEKRKGEDLEGYDLGVSYEAAQ